jgi:hypothetical protein
LRKILRHEIPKHNCKIITRRSMIHRTGFVKELLCFLWISPFGSYKSCRLHLQERRTGPIMCSHLGSNSSALERGNCPSSQQHTPYCRFLLPPSSKYLSKIEVNFRNQLRNVFISHRSLNIGNWGRLYYQFIQQRPMMMARNQMASFACFLYCIIIINYNITITSANK